MSMVHKSKSALELSGYPMRQERIARRVKNVSVSAIKEMMILAAEHQGVISLAQGTPNFLTPVHIREALKRELDTNAAIGKYSSFVGITELKQALAAKLATGRGIKVDSATELFVTCGAMESIASAILTVVDPGDEVILLTPDFPSHFVQINLAEGTPVAVQLVEERGWALDIKTLEQAITPKTKVLVIGNPANPTGAVFSEAITRQVAALAIKHNFWIITDEPYDFLMYDNEPFFSASQIPELKDQLIACFSFSKEYAMSGFRVGYVYAAGDVINQMLKIHDSIAVAAATPSQYAALAALNGPQSVVTEFQKEYSKRRDLMCGHLDRLSDLFSYVKPAGAYYIFPKLKLDMDDYDFAIQLLNEAKVTVVPGSAFGPGGEGHVRLNFATSAELISEAMERIEEWWKNYSNYSN